MLSSSQITFYHERGHVGVEKVVFPEVEELRRVIDDFVERSRAAAGNISTRNNL